MNPFAYEKIKHKRTQTPGLYTNYRQYKPYLQAEFVNKCVYCKSPDTLQKLDSFGVDHYLPKKKFPHLKTHYPNLYYACNTCNRSKGEFWQHPTKKNIFIPNPCDHNMFDHMRFDQEKILHKSEAGKFTIELLDLDSAENEDFRLTTISSLNAIQEQLADLREDLRVINMHLPTLRLLKRSKALREIKKIEKEIQNHEKSLNRLSGNRA